MKQEENFPRYNTKERTDEYLGNLQKWINDWVFPEKGELLENRTMIPDISRAPGFKIGDVLLVLNETRLYEIVQNLSARGSHVEDTFCFPAQHVWRLGIPCPAVVTTVGPEDSSGSRPRAYRNIIRDPYFNSLSHHGDTPHSGKVNLYDLAFENGSIFSVLSKEAGGRGDVVSFLPHLDGGGVSEYFDKYIPFLFTVPERVGEMMSRYYRSLDKESNE